MHSIENGTIRVTLNDKLWDIFSMQAEIESISQSGRAYAESLEHLRKQLIFDAATARVNALFKLEQLRLLPIDMHALIRVATLCYLSNTVRQSTDTTLVFKGTRRLNNASREGLGIDKWLTQPTAKNTSSLSSQLRIKIKEQKQQAQHELNQVMTEDVLKHASTWIKQAVDTLVASHKRQAFFEQRIYLATQLDPLNPAVTALSEAFTLMARDYQADLNYREAAAALDGWQIELVSSTDQYQALLA
mgnify:CR=1 FL=1